jgi:hypothetical protein
MISGMVEERSGFFRAGLEVVFGMLEAEREPGPHLNGESFPRSGSKKCAGQDSNPRPAA